MGYVNITLNMLLYRQLEMGKNPHCSGSVLFPSLPPTCFQ